MYSAVSKAMSRICCQSAAFQKTGDGEAALSENVLRMITMNTMMMMIMMMMMMMMMMMI